MCGRKSQDDEGEELRQTKEIKFSRWADSDGRNADTKCSQNTGIPRAERSLAIAGRGGGRARQVRRARRARRARRVGRVERTRPRRRKERLCSKTDLDS